MIINPETMEDVGADTEGEITVSGPNVMRQYRNNPAANEEVFFMKDGKRYFRTGDMGMLVEGRFLTVTGRFKVSLPIENVMWLNFKFSFYVLYVI